VELHRSMQILTIRLHYGLHIILLHSMFMRFVEKVMRSI
jgi:hypothetical protein